MTLIPSASPLSSGLALDCVCLFIQLRACFRSLLSLSHGSHVTLPYGMMLTHGYASAWTLLQEGGAWPVRSSCPGKAAQHVYPEGPELD